MKTANRLIATIVMSLLSIPAWAGITTTTEVDAVAMVHDAFVLTPAAPSASRPLVVDATPGAIVRLTAVSRTLAVSLIAPNGTRFTIGDPATAIFDGGRSDSTAVADGATYVITLEQPPSGTCTLEVTETAAMSGPRSVVVTTLFENSTRAMLIGGGDTYPLGGNIRLAAVVTDALGKVKNLNVSARMFRPGDASFAPVAVSFRDDGVGADGVAGDAVFSAFVNPPAAGHYAVEANLSGVAANGAFRRTAAGSSTSSRAARSWTALSRSGRSTRTVMG